MLSTFEVNPRSRHGVLAQSHRSGNACWLGRMAQMNELRIRSKCSQIPSGIYNSCLDAIIFQNLNGTIDGKAFGDSSKIDNQVAAKKDFIRTAKKDVARGRGWTKLIA